VETLKLEWEAEKLEGKLNLEAVQVMKVELEQGLGTANGTTGVENGEVKLGWLRRAGWSMVELSRRWSSWGWGWTWDGGGGVDYGTTGVNYW